MGRSYPDVVADPVMQHGYYYSKKFNKLARLKLGDKLPRHMGPWELIAEDGEGSSSEILQRLRDLHPDLDPYRLTFATSTPIDINHLAKSRRGRLVRYGLVGLLASGLGLLIFRRRLRRPS